MKKLRILWLSPLIIFAAIALPLVTPSECHATAIAVTAGSVKPSINAVYLAGDHYAKAAITAGQVVYLDSTITGGSQSPTSPDVGLASATGAGDAARPVGIAVGGAGVGQPVKIVIRDPALTVGGTVSAGAIIELHTTAGAITLTPGDITTGGYVSVLGVGISTTQINFGATSLSGLGYLGIIRADVAM